MKINNGKMIITVNRETEKYIFNGWGASACWWSQYVSDEAVRKDMAEKLYGKSGLGLNIYRYNVGGGVNPEHNRVSNPWRNTESFYVYNDKSGKFEYDFSRDKNARLFMEECLSMGCIDTVILFANSPHYSMTISKEASGSFSDQHVTNISKENYEQFVDYFLTITKHFIDIGVPVKYISPINEPQWTWGGNVRQEGCHYEPEQVYEILELFSKEINKRNLPVKLYCPESGEIGGLTQDYFKRIQSNKNISDCIGVYAYHCYWSDNRVSKKSEFGRWIENNFKNETVDMSEWCELPCKHATTDVKSAVIMARVISNDIQFSNVKSWSAWVCVNQIGINDQDGLDYSDGLIVASNDFSNYKTAYRYYALAHFSKFIPKGSALLECFASANAFWVKQAENDKDDAENGYYTNFNAFKTPDNKIVLVIVNEDDDKEIEIKCPASSQTVYTTDENNTLNKTYAGKFKGKITVTKDSINTIILE